MEIAGFALRDIILVGAVLGGIYIMVMVLRLLHVNRRKAGVVHLPETEAAAAEAADEAEEDIEDEAPAPVEATPVPSPARPAPRAAPPVAEAPAPMAEVVDFGAELQRSQLEREVKELRETVAALRDEIEGLKAANRVAPQYADAMALAQRGLSAMDISARCDISLGEAELVWALAQGPGRFDREEDYGGDNRSIPARNA